MIWYRELDHFCANLNSMRCMWEGNMVVLWNQQKFTAATTETTNDSNVLNIIKAHKIAQFMVSNAAEFMQTSTIILANWTNLKHIKRARVRKIEKDCEREELVPSAMDRLDRCTIIKPAQRLWWFFLQPTAKYSDSSLKFQCRRTSRHQYLYFEPAERRLWSNWI